MRLTRGSALLILLVLAPAAAPAQQMMGFTPASAVAERELEARLRKIPDPASAQRHARALAAVPHVAGSPAQLATAAYVLGAMASYGLDTMRATYRVYLPYPDSTIVERVTTTRRRLDLDEPAIPSDPTTTQPRWPAMNGTSGTGDVTAPVVYVNYGLPTDYAILDSLKISVRGKVVLARYGGSFRGIKAREAELRGAVGLILYSDPKDDGFVRGAVYPEGPWRNANGVQRGSIYNGTGDPSTPGWAAVPGARHLPQDSLAVSRIPVVPISYGNAGLFLQEMTGPAVPTAWQGGLPFPYHIGSESVKARVALWAERGERAYKTIVNTFGIVRGSQFPSEMVIVGGHRDAWGPGAADNVSGVTSILEAARAWGTLGKEGTRPRRTLVFATWDAEEWGLVGSSEWVEQMEDSLRLNAVAYINQDMPAWGRDFGASATTSLATLLRDVIRTIPQPGDTASIYDVWMNRPTRPTFGDLGGGSDFVGFYNHLGIPSIEFGFGGSGGVYHSAYDTPAFMEKFGDPGYLAHATAGTVTAVLMSRLAQSEVIPFNYGLFGAALKDLAAKTFPDTTTANARSLLTAAESFRVAGMTLANAQQIVLDTPENVVPPRPAFNTVDLNARIRTIERTLTRREGLPGRPFMRNLIFASDRDNGYANVALPGIAEAQKDHDEARLSREVKDLVDRLNAASNAMNCATATFGPRLYPFFDRAAAAAALCRRS